MSPGTKKWVKNLLRWGIAIAGVWYVVTNISIRDRVLIPGPDGRPTAASLVETQAEEDKTFRIIDPWTREIREVRRDQVVVRGEGRVIVRDERGLPQTVDLIGYQVKPGTDRRLWPAIVVRPRTYVQKFLDKTHGDPPRIVPASEILSRSADAFPYPVVERGLGEMVRIAVRDHPWYLLISVAVFPLVYIITALRWHALLGALSIDVSRWRIFMINMVGAFYNTFMPGSTGGDLLKAYYASKQTRHKLRAVMSVVIDRAIGLLALVILGGTMGLYQWLRGDPDDPSTRKCMQVAIGSGVILGITALGLAVFFIPFLRKWTLLDLFLRKLPGQRHVRNAVETLETYGRRPALVLAAILVTLPVHATVVLSAMFAGMALGLPLHPLYYWVVVPVVVLAGSIPISPQGAGVMEAFAFILTRGHGATVSHVLALTMSIRLVQIGWNLLGGIFVIRGGFHPPTPIEQASLEDDALPPDAELAPTRPSEVAG
jgi:uncharacterized membrane protein YbhN (UPF0104 family)